MGRKRNKPAPGPSQRTIKSFYRRIEAAAEDGRETGDELEYEEENIPEVVDLVRDASRGRPEPEEAEAEADEPAPPPDSGEDEAEGPPPPSRPRRSVYRRLSASPPRRAPGRDGPESSGSSSSSSSSSGSRDVWTASREDLISSSDGKIQMKVTLFYVFPATCCVA